MTIEILTKIMVMTTTKIVLQLHRGVGSNTGLVDSVTDFCRVVGSPRSSFSLDAWHAENESAAIAVTREGLLLSVPRPRTPARSDNGNNVTGVTHLALHGGSGNQREPIN